LPQPADWPKPQLRTLHRVLKRYRISTSAERKPAGHPLRSVLAQHRAAYAGKFTTAPVLAGRVAQLLGGSLPGAPCAPGRGTVDVADQPFRADRAALVP